VLLLVVFLDMFAVYVGAAVASTRGVFAMARDRRLPGALASVSKRYGTPTAAILLLIAVQAILIVVAEANDTLLALPELPHYFSIFVWCATFGGFALLVVYLLMSLGATRGLATDENKVKLWVSVILGVAITGAAIFGSFYKVTSPTLLAPWSALIWFVLGLLYMLAVKGREPASDALPDLRA
jgi:amino acid transporter